MDKEQVHKLSVFLQDRLHNYLPGYYFSVDDVKEEINEFLATNKKEEGKMCSFNQAVHVEELRSYQDEELAQLAKPQYGVNINGEELHLVLAPKRTMEVKFKDGKIAGLVGMSAKVYQLELDVVRIEYSDGKECFVDLGPGVYWLPERDEK